MAAVRPILLRDLDDPRVAFYRDVRDADLRGAHALFLVESAACIERWLEGVAKRRAGERLPPSVEVHSLLLAPEALERLRPAIDRAEAAPVFVAPPELIERLSGFDHHHGALGLGRRAPDAALDALVASMLEGARTPQAPDPAPAAGATASHRVLLATDGVVHVDNMGSLFRNAFAFGAAGVLRSGDSADPLVRKTIRISMGRVFSVPWATSRDLGADLALLRGRGFRVIVAEDLPDALDVRDCPFGDPCVIVFGAEGRGVARGIIAAADACCRIRTRPGVSINVAVASAIVLHEAMRAGR